MCAPCSQVVSHGRKRKGRMTLPASGQRTAQSLHPSSLAFSSCSPSSLLLRTMFLRAFGGKFATNERGDSRGSGPSFQKDKFPERSQFQCIKVTQRNLRKINEAFLSGFECSMSDNTPANLDGIWILRRRHKRFVA